MDVNKFKWLVEKICYDLQVEEGLDKADIACIAVGILRVTATDPTWVLSSLLALYGEEEKNVEA